MELTFKQNEELNYEAEFKVDGDFNLHIERVSKGPICLMQRGTSEGEYSNSAVLDNDDDTLDYDFAALVYPKWIKVVSGSEVISASVNFNEGGGSGSGESDSGEVIYYKLDEPMYLQDIEYFLKEVYVFSGARGYYDKQIGYYYGTPASIRGMIGSKYSSYGYIDAFEFRPFQFWKSWSDMSLVTYNDLESFSEAFPEIISTSLPRITAEEYWQYYNAE